MPTTEPTINDAIAAELRQTRTQWRDADIVSSESTGLLQSGAKRPDILITEPNVSPVVIETELAPAASVELDARERLGSKLASSGRPILSAIAVRMPATLRSVAGDALRQAIINTEDFQVALLTGTDTATFSRWPSAGWLSMDIRQLSLLAQSASIPPVVIEAAAEQLVSGVGEIAALLAEVASAQPGVTQKIAELLRQEDGEQTRRMAATILANAFVFQESIAHGPDELGQIQTIDELRDTDGRLNKSDVLAEWRRILNVNYWPIFNIAGRILSAVPNSASGEVVEHLAQTASRLTETNLLRSHDLTGAVFQKLIADRKFLAAFYTMPASAALLVGLTLSPESLPTGEPWSDAAALSSIRIADFACGTGTLLSTAYRVIGQFHELASGDAESLHPRMMGDCLIGVDVLPSAAHLTAAMLSGIHPTKRYKDSSILTVGYGPIPEQPGTVTLGSLELVSRQRRLLVYDITARVVEGTGEAEKALWDELQDTRCDLVLMNPPFTRATNHEGDRADVPNPMFAAFDSTVEEQRLMSKATKELFDGTSAHGNAGEASYFLVLADRKVKAGGTIGLVMPLSLLSGSSWEESRRLLRSRYSDLIVVSISGSADRDLSFSADTGMAECLIVGERKESTPARGAFVVLKQRPEYPMMGDYIAERIRDAREAGAMRRLEDGPVGGTPISFGDDVVGYALDAPLPDVGPWGVARISDLELAQTAFQLAEGRLWLPGIQQDEAPALPVTTVGTIAMVGPVDRDINGKNSNGTFRGPFDIAACSDPDSATYPILWAHNADRERSMAFKADKQGSLRTGHRADIDAALRDKAARISSTASHLHFNRDFRFNSQSTAMQFTERSTIGGMAWPSIQLKTESQEKAMVLWGNTSLGLLLHWWHANRQQSGRGRIPVSSLRTMPTLDVTKLSSEQIAQAERLFERFQDRDLKPINEIASDSERHQLDAEFATRVLGLPQAFVQSNGPLDLLRNKLGQEPSIKGSKG